MGMRMRMKARKTGRQGDREREARKKGGKEEWVRGEGEEEEGEGEEDEGEVRGKRGRCGTTAGEPTTGVRIAGVIDTVNG
jgi:hypothetical protein